MSGTARWPSVAYTVFAGGFLFLQGSSTLLARLFPSVDQAIPWLLQLTQLVPIHSALHLATAALALAALLTGRTWLFAIGFGLFYSGLAVAGWVTGSSLCLALQPFDHPFHMALGGLGIAAAGVETAINRARMPA